MVVDSNNISPTKKQKTVPLGKVDVSESQSQEEPGINRLRFVCNSLPSVSDCLDSMYYYNDNCKENPKVINLMLSNRAIPSTIRDDATNPVTVEEGLAIARGVKTLIVHAKVRVVFVVFFLFVFVCLKFFFCFFVFPIRLLICEDSEEVKYCGVPSLLTDLQIKKLIGNEKTFNMRTPAMLLRDQSILLVGWSKLSWTSHAVLRCQAQTTSHDDSLSNTLSSEKL
jgi:hypothetical protein